MATSATRRNSNDLGVIMRITLVGVDPTSNPGGSPTIFRTDRGSWLVQGWDVDDDARTQMHQLTGKAIPDGETVVEIPDRMLPFFQGDGQ
jgi:hypothetical protein